MQNLRIGKIIVALSVLVVLLGFVMHFTTKEPEKSVAKSPSASPTQNSMLRKKFSHQHDSLAPEMETPEETNADEAGLPKLPREKVEEYLARNNRSAASLLAAFHALDDTNYLNEAATNFPNDPQLQWTILARDAFPEERRKWLDAFKSSSPENSLANYFSAADYFKSGQTELAAKELLEASGKKQFKDFSMEARLNAEELSLAAGRTPLQLTHAAGMKALSVELLPELSRLKGLAYNISDLQKHYLDAGDSASANNLAQMQWTLASRLTAGDSGKPAINNLVGFAIEAMTLKQLEQNTAYDFLNGKTPTEALAALKQQKDFLRELYKNIFPVLDSLSEAESASYNDRVNIYGEVEALKWLQQRFGTNSPGQNR